MRPMQLSLSQEEEDKECQSSSEDDNQNLHSVGQTDILSPSKMCTCSCQEETTQEMHK